MAGALGQLGLKRAVVVHGAGGLDEGSLAGPNQLRFIHQGSIQSQTLAPEDLGLSSAPLDSLRGGDLAENQTILRDVLAGAGTDAQRDVVALNTAFVLWSAGVEDDLSKGVRLALDVLEAGQPLERLEALKSNLSH